MAFWNKKNIEERAYSLADPAFAAYLGISIPSLSGVQVGEYSVLGISSVYRSIQILAGVVATLPLKTYRQVDDSRIRVSNFLDLQPAPGMTQFEWTRLVVTHLVLRGNAYLLHVYGGAGQLMGLMPIHPACVTVEYSEQYGKIFKVTVDGEQRVYTPADITHVPGLTLDGLCGVDPLSVLQDTFGTSIAANESAARQFGNGQMVSGLVTSEEDVTAEEAGIIKADLVNRMQGVKNAGDIAFVNRALKFTPWMMDNEKAQFLESRTFQVDEVARIFGLPKVLLAQDGASTWGSGIAELVRGMQKFTLVPITTQIEQRVSMLLPRPQFCAYEYKALFQGTPQEEISALIEQLNAGILTVDEVRRIMDLPPLVQNQNTPPEVEN